MESLDKKNIFVTGGTSGLGRALIKQLIRQGANVATVARNPSSLKNEFPEVIAIQGDVSKPQELYSIVGALSSYLGEVDILINSASYLGVTPLKLLLDTESEDFSKVLETNLLGPFRLIKALLPIMLLKGSGTVVNISSDAAINEYPKWGAYSISKAALEHLTRFFQAELADKNISFLSVDPGDMNTPMHFAAIPDANPAELKDPDLSAKQIISLLKEPNNQQTRITL